MVVKLLSLNGQHRGHEVSGRVLDCFRERHLTSLLAMLEFCAIAFVEIHQAIETLIQIWTNATDQQISSEERRNGRAILILRPDSSNRNIISNHCKTLGLTESLTQLKIIDNWHISPSSATEMRSLISNLRNTIHEELSRTILFRIEDRFSKYFFGGNLFGRMVAVKFKTLSHDIKSAGKCLACGQYNACVYHLMRIMEVGVRYLAKKLHVKITHKDTWGSMTGKVQTKIEKLPGRPNNDQSTAKERAHHRQMSEAYAYLRPAKDAWRNPLSHSADERVFKKTEAEYLLNYVRVFMEFLAKLK